MGKKCVPFDSHLLAKLIASRRKITAGEFPHEVSRVNGQMEAGETHGQMVERSNDLTDVLLDGVRAFYQKNWPPNFNNSFHAIHLERFERIPPWVRDWEPRFKKEHVESPPAFIYNE